MTTEMILLDFLQPCSRLLELLFLFFFFSAKVYIFMSCCRILVSICSERELVPRPAAELSYPSFLAFQASISIAESCFASRVQFTTMLCVLNAC